MLLTLANRAALALENVRLQRETEDQAERVVKAKDAADLGEPRKERVSRDDEP